MQLIFFSSYSFNFVYKGSQIPPIQVNIPVITPLESICAILNTPVDVSVEVAA